MVLFLQSGAPTSPIGARRRGTSGSQGAGQKTKQTERLTAAQQLGTTVPPPHQVFNIVFTNFLKAIIYILEMLYIT